MACDGGASLSLVHRMGRSHTRRFLILNETWDAAAAARAGLVDEVLEGDEALAARAEELARQIATGPTRAIGEIRRLLRLSGEVPAEAQMEAEAQAMARAAASADAREGITAFAQKRQPVFTGK
ncbi:enoyl-CoA hydratase-related protein [Novosphingobium resinovorum]